VPFANINPGVVTILVGAADGAPHRLPASCAILLSQPPFVAGHTMPIFHHNLVGSMALRNHTYQVVFE
jgi:hypothetical protein